ncbi:MAG TPA: hypothetical protein PKV71_09035 [Calditrichia bacterium]|nr:hypothetical protein [Calditrichota bacterium]HQU71067.1 hypothetical protein [Calditrichia bacterium]HQV32008.1 hypothetical protein [Calditrichia bacterium]
MAYLIGEIFGYLLAALLLGFWLGWMAQSLVKKRALTYQNRLWKANLLSKTAEKPDPD